MRPCRTSDSPTPQRGGEPAHADPALAHAMAGAGERVAALSGLMRSSVEHAFFAQKTLAEGFESHECGAHACTALRWLLYCFLRRPAPQSGPPCRPSPPRPRAFAPHAQWPRAMKRCSVLRYQVSRNLNPFAGQLLRRAGPSIHNRGWRGTNRILRAVGASHEHGAALARGSQFFGPLTFFPGPVPPSQ